MIEQDEMAREKKGRKLKARLHFAGITRSSLAPVQVRSAPRDSQVQPTSVLTIHLTCLACPSSCKPLLLLPLWHPLAL